MKIHLLKYHFDRLEDVQFESRDEVDIDYRTKSVVGWNNRTGKLRVRIKQGELVTRTSHFTLGSHQDDVIRLHGNPITAKIESNKESWGFKESASWGLVTIDRNTRKVIGWSNYEGVLKVKMKFGNNATEMTFVTVGSHQDDVVRIEGTPYRIEIDESEETWSYKGYNSYRSWDSYNIVKISRNDRKVVGWTNEGGLKVRLDPGEHVTQSSHFTLGSHRDDVIRLQGTPQKVDKRTWGEVWTYSQGIRDSWVAIESRNDKVTSWYNSGGDIGTELRVLLRPGNRTTHASYFTRGSHQDDVLRLQGTPSFVNYPSKSEKKFGFASSTVTIDRRTDMVIRWDNASGNLKIGTQPRR